jgi:hypothetical protein
MSVETLNSEEVVLNLRVKPATRGQGWSARVESSESGSEIRFQDLPTLVRYLQALSDHRPLKGLR